MKIETRSNGRVGEAELGRRQCVGDQRDDAVGRRDDQAFAHRRDARRNRASIKDCEGAPPLRRIDQFRHAAVKHRRGAVEHDAEHRQEHESGQKRQRDKEQNARGRQALGQKYRRDRAEPRTEMTADEFAERAAGKDECQRKADALHAGAFLLQEKRQKGEEAHARGAVDDADRQKGEEISARRNSSRRIALSLLCVSI